MMMIGIPHMGGTIHLNKLERRNSKVASPQKITSLLIPSLLLQELNHDASVCYRPGRARLTH